MLPARTPNPRFTPDAVSFLVHRTCLAIAVAGRPDIDAALSNVLVGFVPDEVHMYALDDRTRAHFFLPHPDAEGDFRVEVVIAGMRPVNLRGAPRQRSSLCVPP